MAKLTNAPLPISNPETSTGSPSATSSRASGGGVTPSDSPGGPTIDLFGRVVAPVSPSRQRGSRLGATIRATFGRRGFASSKSAALQSSLESRLRRQSLTGGSTWFATTWSEKVTPSGRRVFRLQASARRTSDSDYGSWRSPTAHHPAKGAAQDPAKRMAGGHTLDLQDQVLLASWPTPASRDSKHANARSYQDRTGTTKGEQLANAVFHRGPIWSGLSAETGKRGQLNPAFACWLMGYPAAWDSCGATAMQSCRKSRRK